MLRRTFCKLSLAASNAWLRAVVALFEMPKEPVSVLRVDKLQCEYRTEPLAIEAASPRLSWIISAPPSADRGARQSGFHLLVASSAERLRRFDGDLWDSGVVQSQQSVHVLYAGKRLKSQQACFWKVRIRDGGGLWSDWSEAAQWTMGLLAPEDWQGDWIGGPILTDHTQRTPDPWLRKQVFLDEPPQRVLLHVASVGYHELYVNGEKVSEKVLAPGVSNLKHRVRYVSYDLTVAMKTGDNVVGLWLGTSWSIFPAYRTSDRPEQPLVRVQGMAEFASGRQIDIVSDSSWTTARSPNTLVGTWNVHDFGGERYDARQDVPGWASAEMNDETWERVSVHKLNVALSADGSGGNILGRQLSPVDVMTLADGSCRIDMGVNYAGWFEVELAAEPGTEVHLQFSENRTEVCSFAQRSSYLLGSSGRGIFRNRFNYMAGRWITVSGLKNQPETSQIRGWNIRSAYEKISQFSCDEPLLNSIYETTCWTFENLTLGNYIVDCPHRERTGYGDAEEALRSGVNNYALGGFLSQWAQDWRDVQAADGSIPNSAPTEIGGGGPAWGAFCVTLPWRLYQSYGDTRALSHSLATMVRWLEFMETHAHNDLLVRWGSRWSFLGDWQWPDFGVERSRVEKTGKGLGDTPESLFFNNCYWVYSMRLASGAAEVLGQHELSSRYRARAEEVGAKIHAHFFNAEESSYVNGYPAYLAIALAAEIMPANFRDGVWKRLEDEILVQRSGHIWAGIIGGVVLLNLLIDNRRDDLIYAMASKVDFPSWGEILKGHTTFTEGWGGTGSGLHSSFLYIGSWFIEALAGIRQPAAGYHAFEIDPWIDGEEGPRQAQGSVEAAYGRIASSWKRVGRSVRLEATVPPNTSCRLRLRSCREETLMEGEVHASRASGVRSLAGEANACLVALVAGSYSFRFELRG